MSAMYLAASGRDVTVIEEHRESGKPVHCAGMLSPETVRMSGVSPDILGSANSADVVFPNGKVLSIGRRAPMVYFVDRADLAVEGVMRDVREEFGIGTITAVPGTPKGIAAKMNIEKLLGIKINSCEHFREQARI